MRKIFSIVSVLLLLSACGSIAEKPAQPAAMVTNNAKKNLIYHVNPMPNYMQVIMKHGSDLDLTQTQQATLANWRESHKPIMSNLSKSVKEQESRLRDMALNHAKEDELINQYNQVEELRKQIALTKIKCRSMMRSTLTQEQFAKLQEIYTDQFLVRHAG